MSNPFVGDIKMFAGNFAPRGYALCDGQLLSVSQFETLFSLLGTFYGGDGRSTFGLPDLRGRIPIHMGTGPGLTPRPIGQKSGQENVTLTVPQLPGHTHQLMATSAAGTSSTPGNNMLATVTGAQVYGPAQQPQALSGASISNTGGSQPHGNIAPFQCVNFIISLFGVYPSRT